jgi:hypothetical protein
LVSWLFVLSPGDSQFIGICLVGIGVAHILLHRRAGRVAFSQGRNWPFASKMWDRIGIRRSQILYLGIGVSCTVVGVIFLVKSVFVK